MSDLGMECFLIGAETMCNKDAVLKALQNERAASADIDAVVQKRCENVILSVNKWLAKECDRDFYLEYAKHYP
jgi:hypothetical protein